MTGKNFLTKAGIVAVMMLAALARPAAAAEAARAGDTTVLKWRDGKKAVFLLAFDDSCRSHVTNVIPELKKRGMAGTFYIVPGKGPFQSERKAWEKELPGSGVEYGNHTFTHGGATNAAQLDAELAGCSEVIQACYPDRKQPRLVSFGRPGGVPWTVSDHEKEEALAKYHLVERPSFFGYPIHLKTAEDMCKRVDMAIAQGEMGHLDFHGVGGDWLVTPMDAFRALLDKLDACRDTVWVTDHITYHKYRTEREGAEVKVLPSDAGRIRIRLACTADPALYDEALTLETRVPPDWKNCLVVQGTKRTSVAAAGEAIRYAALPGPDEIVITRP
jgi:peptidoglycan/xylan/chitin deacetylase (PgdA/CDA1 family)